jgi:pSer/pThr/pTyr-binding forkhead associated (FHA) protein
VSRQHVLIRQQGAVWVAEDCGSTKGTQLNNVPLSPGLALALASGDCLILGEWKVIFSEEPVALPVPQTAPTATFAILSEQIIGRDPTCHIVLDHPNVSRRHCRLVQTPQGNEIEDLGSRNGTYLNGVCLTQRERLQPNDDIRIGMALFVFRNNALEYFDQNKTVGSVPHLP